MTPGTSGRVSWFPSDQTRRRPSNSGKCNSNYSCNCNADGYSHAKDQGRSYDLGCWGRPACPFS